MTKAEQLVDTAQAQAWEVLLWQQMLLVEVGQHFWTEAEMPELVKRFTKIGEFSPRRFEAEPYFAHIPALARTDQLTLHKVTRTA